jgi:hypothetical protein
LSETFTISQGRFDLVITAGSTFPNAFADAVFYPTDNVGAPFSLTDWRALLQIRDAVTGELALEVTPDVDETLNCVKFSISADDTALLTLPNYVWACELKQDDTHKVMTLARGLVEVLPEIVID